MSAVAPVGMRLELLGFQGGRLCRCWVAELAANDDAEPQPVWTDAAEVMRHPLFDTLPAEDRIRVAELAQRAAVRPWERRS